MQALTLFKCLSDETRLYAMLLLTQMGEMGDETGELCVCELMVALDESQPKISRHLAQLRQCGLLQAERRGQWVFYRLNPALPEWVSSLLQLTVKHNTEALKPLQQRLQAMVERPAKVPLCDSFKSGLNEVY